MATRLLRGKQKLSNIFKDRRVRERNAIWRAYHEMLEKEFEQNMKERRERLNKGKENDPEFEMLMQRLRTGIKADKRYRWKVYPPASPEEVYDERRKSSRRIAEEVRSISQLKKRLKA